LIKSVDLSDAAQVRDLYRHLANGLTGQERE